MKAANMEQSRLGDYQIDYGEGSSITVAVTCYSYDHDAEAALYEFYDAYGDVVFATRQLRSMRKLNDCASTEAFNELTGLGAWLDGEFGHGFADGLEDESPAAVAISHLEEINGLGAFLDEYAQVLPRNGEDPASAAIRLLDDAYLKPRPVDADELAASELRQYLRDEFPREWDDHRPLAAQVRPLLAELIMRRGGAHATS